MKDSKSNILVLTSLYPADDIPKSDTPVVHYFTKEWVKQGHRVQVIHFAYNLPSWAFWVVRTFPRLISKVWGGVLRTRSVTEREYKLDGVAVRRIPLKKIRPHGCYSHKQIEAAYKKCISYLYESQFEPTVVISHWSNPQLLIMQKLKAQFNLPAVYVAHNKGEEVEKAYGSDATNLIKTVDLIGFRSRAIEEEFRERFCYQGPSFRCYSGIPELFTKQEAPVREFKQLNRFIYVGTFIKRKYPNVIIPAVQAAMGTDSYTITFIGKGNQENVVRNQIKQEHLNNQVQMLGYLEREKVNQQLCSHDIFVMISRGETFGLVYLEAMSTGCITIAAKDEGMDGIIQHGVNGFLCNAGCQEELTSLIKEIREMPKDNLRRISVNAIETARRLTDKKVAEDYLNNIVSLCNSCRKND